MNSKLLSLRKTIFHFILLRWAMIIETVHVFFRYLKLSFFYQRRNLVKSMADNQDVQRTPPKVLAVIPHITSVEEAKNREKAVAKIDKLKNTIDGLISSFAHCQLTIVVKTVADRYITGYLPDYQINCIQVHEESDCDPMFIGFRCQDELVKRVDEFDWFLFLEDDIILYDSYLLEKLEKFNTNSGYERAILFPNRYELWEGTKRYIDLTIDTKIGWNALSAVEIEGVKFAECTNPHSGFYCLSKPQIQRWIKSGRAWKNKELMVGPLESAATYCLMECFTIYKPHPSNLNFLEVRHYDTKYSQLYPELSPSYIFSPIKNLSTAYGG